MPITQTDERILRYHHWEILQMTHAVTDVFSLTFIRWGKACSHRNAWLDAIGLPTCETSDLLTSDSFGVVQLANMHFHFSDVRTYCIHHDFEGKIFQRKNIRQSLACVVQTSQLRESLKDYTPGIDFYLVWR